MQVAPVCDGKQMADARGQRLDVLNPATGKVVARQLCCGSDDVERVIHSSERAFASEQWQGLSPAERGALLLRLADAIESRAERLIELELLEAGKPIAQFRDSEIPFVAALLRFYPGAADKIKGR